MRKFGPVQLAGARGRSARIKAAPTAVSVGYEPPPEPEGGAFDSSAFDSSFDI